MRNDYRRDWLRGQVVFIVLRVCVVVMLMVSPLFFIMQAHASAPYNASDVLSQVDDNGIPSFNTKNRNGRTSPNAIGLVGPSGTTVDPIGHRLFVSDEFNYRVLVYSLDSNNHINSYTASYVLGQPNFTTSTASSSPSASNLYRPQGLVWDATRNYLFVADFNNNRVVVFDLSGSITNGMAASYVLGQPNFTSNSASVQQNQMSGPSSLAYDNATKQLFVAELTGHRILIFDTTAITNGMGATHFLAGTQIDNGGDIAASISYDATRKLLFAADHDRNRVAIFDLTTITDGEQPTGVLGQPDLSTTTARTTQNGLSNPAEVSFEPTTKRLYTMDQGNNRVMVYDTTVITDGMNASYVLGQPNFTSNAAVTTQSGMHGPAGGFAFGSAFFVTDAFNSRILSYDTTTLTNGENATGVLGQTVGLNPQTPSFTTNASDNLNPNDQSFLRPYDVAVDTVHHRLFICDSSNNRIVVYTLDADNNLASRKQSHVLGQATFNTDTYQAGATGLDSPFGIDYDAVHDRLFVSDSNNNRTLIYDTTTITDGMAASYVLGQPDFNQQTADTTQTAEAYPTDVHYDPLHNRIFVADSDNVRVLIYDLTSPSNGMAASNVLGQPNFTSSNSATTGTGFDYPYGLAYDTTHDRLFIADNRRVLTFDLAGISNGMAASNVLGQPNFTSSNGTPSKNGLVGPGQLYMDTKNHTLYVIDGAYRIVTFDTATITDGMDATGVIGQPDFTSSSSGLSQSQINYPEGIGFDPTNNRLYLAEDNHRVLLFDFAHLRTSLPQPIKATSYNQTLGSQTQGVATYTVTIVSLPTWLTLNLLTGTISGTPTTNGSYTFSVKVVDDNGAVGSFSDNQTYTLLVSDQATNEPANTPSSGSANSQTISSTNQTLGSKPQQGSNSDLPISDQTPESSDSTDISSPVTERQTPAQPQPASTSDAKSKSTHIWWLAGGITIFGLAGVSYLWWRFYKRQ